MDIIWIQDEFSVRGLKRFRLVYVLEKPPDLEDAIASLIDIGLSNVDRMPEVLRIMEDILSRDRRFADIAADMRRYREIIINRSVNIPFTMIEARAILSRFRKWQNAIERVMRSNE